MTPDNPPPDPAAELVDFGPPLQQYLAGNPSALTKLPPHERELAERLAPILQSARQTPPADLAAEQDEVRRADDSLERVVPPRDRDPIAIALGLVSSPDDILDAARFKTARMRSGLDIKAVAQRLTQRGWAISVKQVFRWQDSNVELAPALIDAIADALAVRPATLRAHPTASRPTSTSALLDDDVITAFLTDWAHQVGRTTSDIRSQAQLILAGMNYRNEGIVSRDDVLAVLRALRRFDPDDRSHASS